MWLGFKGKGHYIAVKPNFDFHMVFTIGSIFRALFFFFTPFNKLQLRDFFPLNLFFFFGRLKMTKLFCLGKKKDVNLSFFFSSPIQQPLILTPACLSSDSPCIIMSPFLFFRVSDSLFLAKTHTKKRIKIDLVYWHLIYQSWPFHFRYLYARVNQSDPYMR